MGNPCQKRSPSVRQTNETIADHNSVQLQIQKAPKDVVHHWLSDIGLTEYHEILKAEGYETVADLKTISFSDLRAMGITKQMHVKRILIRNGQGTADLNAAKEYEGTSQGTGTNASANMQKYPPPSNYQTEGNDNAPPAYDQV